MSYFKLPTQGTIFTECDVCGDDADKFQTSSGYIIIASFLTTPYSIRLNVSLCLKCSSVIRSSVAQRSGNLIEIDLKYSKTIGKFEKEVVHQCKLSCPLDRIIMQFKSEDMLVGIF